MRTYILVFCCFWDKFECIWTEGHVCHKNVDSWEIFCSSHWLLCYGIGTSHIVYDYNVSENIITMAWILFGDKTFICKMLSIWIMTSLFPSLFKTFLGSLYEYFLFYSCWGLLNIQLEKSTCTAILNLHAYISLIKWWKWNLGLDWLFVNLSCDCSVGSG